VGQGLVRSGDPGQERRELFHIFLGPKDKVCVFGKDFPDLDDWCFKRFRRKEGKWVRDASSGLSIEPQALERFRDGLIREAHRLGSTAPALSFTYLSERYRNQVENGEDEAIVPHLVLKALAMALGNGDRDAAGRMGREALKYIRTQLPDFVSVGDGDGLLDQKGDDGRSPGKERVLRAATQFCREHGDDTDYEGVANDLGWAVERVHPKALRAELLAVANAARASCIPPEKIPPAQTTLYESLERDLQMQRNPTPEAVARLALSSFGVPEEKVKHYFDYRYSGVSRRGSRTIRLPGRGETLSAYVARPKKSGEVSHAVVVLPEMFGVTDHAEQVARRLAREGYLAVVPHFLRGAINPSDHVERVTRIAQAGRSRRNDELSADLVATLRYLEDVRHIKARQVALLGFEAGAEMAHEWLRSGSKRVGAAVAFYGAGAPSGSRLHAPLLTLIGERDPWFTRERREELQAELQVAGDKSELRTFEAAGRGFFDPGFERENLKKSLPEPPARAPGYFNLWLSRFYHPIASRDAWETAITFLDEHLGR